jgi:hypothetical protein
MATEIFDKPINDHAVFDRIVDADRTITLARQAADKAEAEGKADKAAVLRAKADHLEQILQATQQPDYEDEIESVGQGPDATGGSGGDSGQQGTQDGKGGNSNDSGQAPGSNDNDTKNGSGSSDAQGTGDSSETPDDSTKGQDSSGGGDASDNKTPDDISNIDQNNGSHEGGTNKSNQGGPSGGASGGSGGSGGQGQSQNGNSNSSNNKQKELDPFRRSLGGQGQQGDQPTPQQILDAVIKRLSRLSGNAKVGADRALRQLYDQLSDGSEAIDD